MRLIDADELMMANHWTKLSCKAYKEVLVVLITAPVIDAKPTVKSCWSLEREPDGTPYCFHCLNCDADEKIIGNTVMTKFCPDCGAEMDEHGYMDGGRYHEVD